MAGKVWLGLIRARMGAYSGFLHCRWSHVVDAVMLQGNPGSRVKARHCQPALALRMPFELGANSLGELSMMSIAALGPWIAALLATGGAGSPDSSPRGRFAPGVRAHRGGARDRHAHGDRGRPARPHPGRREPYPLSAGGLSRATGGPDSRVRGPRPRRQAGMHRHVL